MLGSVSDDARRSGDQERAIARHRRAREAGADRPMRPRIAIGADLARVLDRGAGLFAGDPKYLQSARRNLAADRRGSGVLASDAGVDPFRPPNAELPIAF